MRTLCVRCRTASPANRGAGGRHFSRRDVRWRRGGELRRLPPGGYGEIFTVLPTI